MTGIQVQWCMHVWLCVCVCVNKEPKETVMLKYNTCIVHDHCSCNAVFEDERFLESVIIVKKLHVLLSLTEGYNVVPFGGRCGCGVQWVIYQLFPVVYNSQRLIIHTRLLATR